MTRTTRTFGPSLAAIAFATLVGTGAMAQTATTDEEHSAHHPGSAQTVQAAPAPATPPQAMPGMMMGGPGMMDAPSGTGIPDEGERRRMMMMRHGAGGAPMNVIINVGPGIRVDIGDEDGRSGRRGGMGMGPPGGAGTMGGPGMMGGPGIMGQIGPRGGPMGPDVLRHFDRVDAHLAYVRAALRITDAQAPQWNAFSDAARAAAERLRQAYSQAMQAATQPAAAPAQLERRAALLAARLDAVRAIATAMGTLYGALSDEQKRTADELIAEHHRAMPMRGR